MDSNNKCRRLSKEEITKIPGLADGPIDVLAVHEVTHKSLSLMHQVEKGQIDVLRVQNHDFNIPFEKTLVNP